MDIDRYIHLCYLFNEQYFSNCGTDSQPLIKLRHWCVRKLYWI